MGDLALLTYVATTRKHHYSLSVLYCCYFTSAVLMGTYYSIAGKKVGSGNRTRDLFHPKEESYP
jgi:hypothetical protein